MPKTALITGIAGQDGAYLAQLLMSKGYKVLGTHRRSSGNYLSRLEELGIAGEVEPIDVDLTEYGNIHRVVEKVRPDELYNLAAQSFVGTSFEQPIYTSEVNAIGTARVLEAIRTVKPDTRFYQASTSEMFGNSPAPQSEATPFAPVSPYGIAKLYAHHLTRNYRESFGLHATSGILFNHESPLRGREFVTRKITLGLARVVQGKQRELTLGNLDAKRDWGFAGDYVEGMWRMLQQDKADDYVLATGTMTSVRRFVELAGRSLGKDIVWEGKDERTTGIERGSGAAWIKIEPRFYRPVDVWELRGDASKARNVLAWQPKTDIEALVAMMVRTDYDRVAADRVTF